MTEISQLPPVEELASGDQFPVQQLADGITRYATPAQIQTAAGALIAQNNLEDVGSAQAARNNLGLGGASVLGVGAGFQIVSGNLAAKFGTTTGTVADGGALASTATVATSAQTTAGQAVTAAGAAAETATQAQTTASGAVETANTASSAASEALTAANAAIPLAAPAVQFPISNAAIIPSSYTIPAASNAVNFGPITIAPGATVTVPQSSTYRIF